MDERAVVRATDEVNGADERPIGEGDVCAEAERVQDEDSDDCDRWSDERVRGTSLATGTSLRPANRFR
jgi:hypothetical protein